MIEITRENIDEISLDLPLGNSFWQSFEWIKLIIKGGQAEKVFVVEHRDVILRTNDKMIVEKRAIGGGEYGLFVIGAYRNVEDYEKQLIDLCRAENSMFIQLEYFDYDKHINSVDFEIFHEGFHKKFITPYTATIDLTKSEEDILASMKPKGRYNIRLAEKKGVVVKEVQKTDGNIQIFYNLMEETTKRDEFNGNSLEFYKTFLREVDSSKLYIAEVEGVAIASGIFVDRDFYSIYYYGASTTEKKYRKLMAPYLLQWKAICDSKDLGLKIYDFLGIAEPGNKKSSLAGVTDFKMKLADNSVFVSKGYIYVNKKTKYFFFKLGRFIKKIIKK